jgi:UDP-N-acetyl-D-glucosamine dehydrogenase
MGRLFYAQALEQVVPVSSTQVAEMVKLLENTFRMINIGLANEIAMMCDRIGINVWEVIDAAATKPFGFMPFYPGPGLGGHCIPIDPFYLSWKTKQAGIEARFIDLAGYINGQMPHFVVDKIQNALNDASKPIKGSHIHIMGAAYKRDIDDMRESPALDVMLLLLKRGARITYSDPHVPRVRLDGIELTSSPEDTAGAADCAVIITDHQAFDYPGLLARARLIVDTRNALKGRDSGKIVRL